MWSLVTVAAMWVHRGYPATPNNLDQMHKVQTHCCKEDNNLGNFSDGTWIPSIRSLANCSKFQMDSVSVLCNLLQSKEKRYPSTDFL
ncbi:hypothetical protein SETIT_1G188100v2 [Setaria italica]|uniref:Uncharacterized protein n=1 Tax=Setaria italica TaxID=4555 RepID=A0A368PMN1_SETIT|nr:hypothetical protein SETIT_1G188100v2 [Setaria italica]